jgi:hypothetical protein
MSSLLSCLGTHPNNFGWEQQMIAEIKVEFMITGTMISPEEISTLLGMKPTRTWRRGDLIQATRLKYKQDGWCLSSKEIGFNLSDHITSLLDNLLPNSEKIVKVCSRYGLESQISCAIYIVDETPIINFSKKVMADMTQLNTTLDIDIILTR